MLSREQDRSPAESNGQGSEFLMSMPLREAREAFERSYSPRNSRVSVRTSRKRPIRRHGTSAALQRKLKLLGLAAGAATTYPSRQQTVRIELA